VYRRTNRPTIIERRDNERMQQSRTLGHSPYVDGIGFVTPWLITEIPAGPDDVSSVDRIFPGQLLRLYAVSLFLVATLWGLLRLAANGAAFLRGRA
jgi:hypothetical protein